MHEAISFLLRETASKVIEAAVDRVFATREAAAPQAAQASHDPVTTANALANLFLGAVRDRNLERIRMLSHPEWLVEPATPGLLAETLNAAAPVSWRVQLCHVPGDWSEGTELPWVVAELAVTFDLKHGRYTTIPAALRGVRWDGMLRVDYLWWGTS